MKKLLSPTLNRWFCYALVLLCSATYAQPCTFNDVIEGVGDFIPKPQYWQYGWEEFRY